MYTETESRYPVKESTLKLTGAQRHAAMALLRKRPSVIPGTRVILDDAARRAWFDSVTEEIDRLNLQGQLVSAFCDVAGVPD